MDPRFNKDGKPYGPIRYKEIVKERYMITKNLNTSYTDVGKITPRERLYLMEFIADEIQKTKELAEQRKRDFKKKQ